MFDCQEACYKLNRFRLALERCPHLIALESAVCYLEKRRAVGSMCLEFSHCMALAAYVLLVCGVPIRDNGSYLPDVL